MELAPVSLFREEDRAGLNMDRPDLVMEDELEHAEHACRKDLEPSSLPQSEVVEQPDDASGPAQRTRARQGRQPSEASYAVGDVVQYWSASKSAWLPGQVREFRGSGVYV